jgi:hypothetical protein
MGSWLAPLKCRKLQYAPLAFFSKKNPCMGTYVSIFVNMYIHTYMYLCVPIEFRMKLGDEIPDCYVSN